MLLSSSTGYQTFKHGFQISKHVLACRHVKIGPDVHASCRKAFTRLRDVKKLKFEAEPEPEFRSLRSATGSFAWKFMCFLCGSYAIDSVDIRHLCTLEIGCNVILKCDDHADSWSYEIRGRLNHATTLWQRRPYTTSHVIPGL